MLRKPAHRGLSGWKGFKARTTGGCPKLEGPAGGLSPEASRRMSALLMLPYQLEAPAAVT